MYFHLIKLPRQCRKNINKKMLEFLLLLHFFCLGASFSSFLHFVLDGSFKIIKASFEGQRFILENPCTRLMTSKFFARGKKLPAQYFFMFAEVFV